MQATLPSLIHLRPKAPAPTEAPPSGRRRRAMKRGLTLRPRSFTPVSDSDEEEHDRFRVRLISPTPPVQPPVTRQAPIEVIPGGLFDIVTRFLATPDRSPAEVCNDIAAWCLSAPREGGQRGGYCDDDNVFRMALAAFGWVPRASVKTEPFTGENRWRTIFYNLCAGFNRRDGGFWSRVATKLRTLPTNNPYTRLSVVARQRIRMNEPRTRDLIELREALIEAYIADQPRRRREVVRRLFYFGSVVQPTPAPTQLTSDFGALWWYVQARIGEVSDDPEYWKDLDRDLYKLVSDTYKYRDDSYPRNPPVGGITYPPEAGVDLVRERVRTPYADVREKVQRLLAAGASAGLNGALNQLQPMSRMLAQELRVPVPRDWLVYRRTEPDDPDFNVPGRGASWMRDDVRVIVPVYAIALMAQNELLLEDIEAQPEALMEDYAFGYRAFPYKEAFIMYMTSSPAIDAAMDRLFRHARKILNVRLPELLELASRDPPILTDRSFLDDNLVGATAATPTLLRVAEVFNVLEEIEDILLEDAAIAQITHQSYGQMLQDLVNWWNGRLQDVRSAETMAQMRAAEVQPASYTDDDDDSMSASTPPGMMSDQEEDFDIDDI